jgi:hypothetical protein
MMPRWLRGTHGHSYCITTAGDEKQTLWAYGAAAGIHVQVLCTSGNDAFALETLGDAGAKTK